jgi:hypothetical protein
VPSLSFSRPLPTPLSSRYENFCNTENVNRDVSEFVYSCDLLFGIRIPVMAKEELRMHNGMVDGLIGVVQVVIFVASIV